MDYLLKGRFGETSDGFGVEEGGEGGEGVEEGGGEKGGVE